MKCESKIIVIGDFFPSVYEGKKDIIFVKSLLIGLPFLGNYLGRASLKPRIIHAFDIVSAAYASGIARKLNVPFVFTKPGGAKLRRHHLPYRNQIVFHKEDYDDFMSRRFKPDNIALIPHRVSKVNHNSLRLSPFDSKIGDGVLRILCISRIGSFYRLKIQQAINLNCRLNEMGVRSELSIVGIIEDNAVFENFLQNSSSHLVSFRTDPSFYHNASELLYFADVVVAGGRSFMESFSLGKPTFFPVRNSELPCFALRENIAEAAVYNFSERVELSDILNPELSLGRFVKLTKSSADEYRIWAKEFFTDNFCIDAGIILHSAFYKNLQVPEPYIATKLNLFSVVASAVFAMIP